MSDQQLGNKKVRIIITGGTFDKQYDAIAGHLTFKDSHLPEILRFSRCRIPYELEINQLNDSLDMGDEERNHILNSCQNCEEEKILIIHGTDTMTVTSALLAESIKNKTIVITGAMVPYSIKDSDALFNLGTAMSAVQLLDHGVYIAMNGQLFPEAEVEKNRAEGFFQNK